jgi:hypothetical protein
MRNIFFVRVECEVWGVDFWIFWIFDLLQLAIDWQNNSEAKIGKVFFFILYFYICGTSLKIEFFGSKF